MYCPLTSLYVVGGRCRRYMVLSNTFVCHSDDARPPLYEMVPRTASHSFTVCWTDCSNDIHTPLGRCCVLRLRRALLDDTKLMPARSVNSTVPLMFSGTTNPRPSDPLDVLAYELEPRTERSIHMPCCDCTDRRPLGPCVAAVKTA